MHRSLHAALTAGILSAIATACDDGNRVRVLDRSGEGADSATRLMVAVSEAAAQDDAPQAYRELARAIEEMRPFDDGDLDARAERHLVFLALAPLASRVDAPLADQAEMLALTVWPTALEIEPRPEESPDSYLERVCGDKLARECKHVVPAYRALVVSELVWRRLKHRAHSAYAACRSCKSEPSYQRSLAAYHEHQTAVSSRRASLGERIHPQRWPRAAGHARPYPEDAPLLVIYRDGRSELRGEAIERGGWRESILEARHGAKVLGVHLHPTASVALVRDILHYANRAGYRDVALATVAPDYPYERLAYLISVREREGSVRVRVRDVETIQILVQAIAAHLENLDQRVRL